MDYAEVHLDRALELASIAASHDEVPIGAVVLKDHQIIAEGYNQKESLYNPCAHAEIIALQEAGKILQNWRLIECTLITTLEPCPMCLFAAQQARIKKIIYLAKDLKGGALSLNYNGHNDPRLNHHFEVEWIEREASKIMLQQFFLRKRQKNR